MLFSPLSQLPISLNRPETPLHSGENRLGYVHGIADTLKAFQDKFSPAKLAELDGAALLEKLHARNVEAKCLMYWLEFKDDDEFRGGRMGSIGGGSAVCQLPLRQGALKTIMDKCTRRRDWPTSTARRCL